jgi:hypothetical protein
VLAAERYCVEAGLISGVRRLFTPQFSWILDFLDECSNFRRRGIKTRDKESRIRSPFYNISFADIRHKNNGMMGIRPA